MGFLDGSWTQAAAPNFRAAQYFNPLVLPSWKKLGDRNDYEYAAIFETHNYMKRKSSGGRLQSESKGKGGLRGSGWLTRPCVRGDVGCGLFVMQHRAVLKYMKKKRARLPSQELGNF